MNLEPPKAEFRSATRVVGGPVTPRKGPPKFKQRQTRQFKSKPPKKGVQGHHGHLPLGGLQPPGAARAGPIWHHLAPGPAEVGALGLETLSSRTPGVYSEQMRPHAHHGRGPSFSIQPALAVPISK
uniref:Retinal rod rhodopsin-sensitive cGMP 3',5'-cyclic phosphodiesterase subunit gamma n=1 Tax=Macaca fascicularis TaxID=9541 RepID=A0A7N9C866_MACFA